MKIIDIVRQLPNHPQLGQQFFLDGKIYVLRYKERDLNLIDGVSLHHSGDEGNPWSWAKYHILPRSQGGPAWTPGGIGAPGICYHYAVMRDGRVFKLNYDKTQCWHTAGHNDHLFGVVFQGDFTKSPPSVRQIASGIWLLEQLLSYEKIRSGYPDNIKGHGEWEGNNTSCPGTWIEIALKGALMRGGLCHAG